MGVLFEDFRRPGSDRDETVDAFISRKTSFYKRVGKLQPLRAQTTITIANKQGEISAMAINRPLPNSNLSVHGTRGATAPLNAANSVIRVSALASTTLDSNSSSSSRRPPANSPDARFVYPWGSCTCPKYLKESVCKHSLRDAMNHHTFKPPASILRRQREREESAIPLGFNKKPGKITAKAAKASAKTTVRMPGRPRNKSRGNARTPEPDDAQLRTRGGGAGHGLAGPNCGKSTFSGTKPSTKPSLAKRLEGGPAANTQRETKKKSTQVDKVCGTHCYPPPPRLNTHLHRQSTGSSA